MADIILYDNAGNPINCNGVDKLVADTATEGSYATFTYGDLLTGASISPDFSNGNDTYCAPAGKVVRELTVNKPATLIPENIAKDVVIAGVAGAAPSGGSKVFDRLNNGTNISFSSSHAGAASDLAKLNHSVTFSLPTGAKISHIVSVSGWYGVIKYGTSVSNATMLSFGLTPVVVTGSYNSNGINITVDESGAAPTITVILTATDNSILNLMVTGSGNNKAREGGICTAARVIVFYD